MSKGLEALERIKPYADSTIKADCEIIEKDLLLLRRIMLLIERVDFIFDKHYIVFKDGHYIMISNNLYKILKEVLENDNQRISRRIKK